MKRILVVSSDYEPSYGGIGIHVKNLVRELIEQGYLITLLVGRMKTNKEYTYNSKEIYCVTCNTEELKVIEIKTDFMQMLSEEEQTIISNLEEKEVFDYYTAILNQLFVRGAVKYLSTSEDSYQLIHLHDAFISFGAVMLSKYLKIPLIATIHSMNSEEEWLIDNIRRYLVNNIDRIICVSDFIRNEIINRFIFKDKSKMLTIHNSINLSIRERKLPVSSNGEIVFCGRLERVKGVDILIHAVSRLSKAYAEKVKLTIIGEGTEESYLKSLCVKLNMQNQVEFTGMIQQEDVFQYYDRAMCTVLPSRKEAFATTALEAMSRGCCVVASDIGGFTELIQNGEDGFLFEKENIQELTNRLAYIIDNTEAVNEMGKKAQLKVSSEYSWNNTAKKIGSIYKEVCTECSV